MSSNDPTPLKPLLNWIDTRAAVFGFQQRHTAKTYTQLKPELTSREIDLLLPIIFTEDGGYQPITGATWPRMIAAVPRLVWWAD